MKEVGQGAPVQDRIIIIDIIRGFALFGILLVNTPTLNSSAFLDGSDFAFQSTAMDHLVTKIIFTFALGSFYPIFALLFGIGAAIFLSKKGPQTSKLFLRRMTFLFFIGLIDLLFIWWGDILFVYSVLGFLLIFFAGLNTKKLGMLTLGIMLIVLGLGIYQNFHAQPQISSWPDVTSIYAQGSFFEITIQRAKDYIQLFFLNMETVEVIAYYLGIFGIMLLGMWVHKKNLLKDIDKNPGLIAIIGTASASFVITYLILTEYFSITLLVPKSFKGFAAGLSYISFMILFFRTRVGFYILKPLALNGRMSLSCYLAFNLSLSLIFYGYGLGLYGSMGPAMLMPIVFSLYVASLLFSSWWLKHFAFGPAEWIWRLSTYGKINELFGHWARLDRFLKDK